MKCLNYPETMRKKKSHYESKLKLFVVHVDEGYLTKTVICVHKQ